MGQVLPEAVDAYIRSLHPPVDGTIEAVGREGRSRGLPLLDAASARLLRTLVIATGARQILEVGTAIGYSGMWMAAALPADGRLITLETDPDRAATARANFERAGLASRVTVVLGDAIRMIGKIAGPFDLVFQDSSKLIYGPLLDRLVALLRPGGLLVSDNVLWGGEVVDGFVAQPRHDAADTEALKAYNQRLAADSRLLTTFVPIGDGLAVSVKTAL